MSTMDVTRSGVMFLLVALMVVSNTQSAGAQVYPPVYAPPPAYATYPPPSPAYPPPSYPPPPSPTYPPPPSPTYPPPPTPSPSPPPPSPSPPPPSPSPSPSPPPPSPISGNVVPVITSSIISNTIVRLGNAITLTVEFEDSDAADSHTLKVTWNANSDGNIVETYPIPLGDRSIEVTYTYAATGLYALSIEVADDKGGKDIDFLYATPIAVYDPITAYIDTASGTGVISPAGSYPADPTADGRAQFSLLITYKSPEDTKPTGHVKFSFSNVPFLFRAQVFDYLVVSGNTAYLKGRGYFVGKLGLLPFTFIATDVQPGSPPNLVPSNDSFRLVITSESGEIIYDNLVGGQTPTLTRGDITLTKPE